MYCGWILMIYYLCSVHKYTFELIIGDQFPGCLILWPNNGFGWFISHFHYILARLACPSWPACRLRCYILLYVKCILYICHACQTCQVAWLACHYCLRHVWHCHSSLVWLTHLLFIGCLFKHFFQTWWWLDLVKDLGQFSWYSFNWWISFGFCI